MKLDNLPPDARQHMDLFRKLLPLQIKLHEIVRSIGKLEGERCLDIGATNGLLCHHLRNRGGEWDTVVTDVDLAEKVRAIVPERVHVLENDTLGFENKTFDLVVVADMLERVASAEAFIEECHRVIKADGRLIVNTSRAKHFALIRLQEKALGLTPERSGRLRSGYTESELFSILKNGFDVHHVRSYSRFFMEFVDTWVRFFRYKQKTQPSGPSGRLPGLYSVAGIFYRVAYQLDFLMFLNKGYYLIATAKRRTWRSRRTPVLTDGRTISEAVLTRPSR